MILTHRVTEEEGGNALLFILRRSMGLSGTAVKRLKAYGGLLVDGVPRFTNYRVSPGELVTADVSLAEAEGDCQPEAGPVEVLYEDEGLLAVSKPPGLLVHPSRARYTGTLANFVAGYLRDGGGRPICHAVNRLDRDTSGVVLFAKNAHMKTLAAAALAAGEKGYTALVWGALSPADGVIDLPIARLRERDMLRVVSPTGRRAVTHYRTLARGQAAGRAYSALEITLETGRTHQIRVHCLARGAPLIGDPLYATAESRAGNGELGAERQLLHSGLMAFTHPVSGLSLTIRAPVGDPVFLRLLSGAERLEKTCTNAREND